jgi:hypothetical protein
VANTALSVTFDFSKSGSTTASDLEYIAVWPSHQSICDGISVALAPIAQPSSIDSSFFTSFARISGDSSRDNTRPSDRPCRSRRKRDKGPDTRSPTTKKSFRTANPVGMQRVNQHLPSRLKCSRARPTCFIFPWQSILSFPRPT